ncbi:MAG: hypothetical protein ABJB74_17180 [Gemmatimonas sp.]
MSFREVGYVGSTSPGGKPRAWDVERLDRAGLCAEQAGFDAVGCDLTGIDPL